MVGSAAQLSTFSNAKEYFVSLKVTTNQCGTCTKGYNQACYILVAAIVNGLLMLSIISLCEQSVSKDFTIKWIQNRANRATLMLWKAILFINSLAAVCLS